MILTYPHPNLVTADRDRDDAVPTAVRTRLTTHLNHNVDGILYGAVLAAAATTIVSAQPTKTRYVAVSILLMLGVYPLAHLYATCMPR